MKLRMIAAIAGLTIVGGIGVTAEANASVARVGGKCSVSEVGQFRTVHGKKLRCTSTGASGTKWVRVAPGY